MGKLDTFTKLFFEDPEVYADTFNLAYYDGEPVVSGKDITELDPSESGKQRDLLRMVTIERSGQKILSGMEINCYHDDVLPYRSLHYDVKRYEHLLRNARKNGTLVFDVNQNHNILHVKTEPVLTMVISLCKEPWKGTVSLRDMTDLKEENLISEFPDYKMKLLDPHTMDDEQIEKCRSQLKYVLYLVKYRNNVNKFKELIERMRDVKLSQETMDVIHAVIGVKLNTKKETEVIDNMYEAQEMWLEEETTKIRKYYEKEATRQRRKMEKAQKATLTEREAKEKAQKATLTEREAKEKAQAETNHIVKALYQLVMDQVISKSEAIRISGMSAYRFMKIVRSMNP